MQCIGAVFEQKFRHIKKISSFQQISFYSVNCNLLPFLYHPLLSWWIIMFKTAVHFVFITWTSDLIFLVHLSKILSIMSFDLACMNLLLWLHYLWDRFYPVLSYIDMKPERAYNILKQFHYLFDSGFSILDADSSSDLLKWVVRK